MNKSGPTPVKRRSKRCQTPKSSRKAIKTPKPSRSNKTKRISASVKKSKSEKPPSTSKTGGKRGHQQITAIDKNKFQLFSLCYRVRPSLKVSLGSRNIKSNHPDTTIQRQIFNVMLDHPTHSAPRKIVYQTVKNNIKPGQFLRFKDAIAEFIMTYEEVVDLLLDKYKDKDIDKLFIEDVSLADKNAAEILSKFQSEFLDYCESLEKQKQEKEDIIKKTQETERKKKIKTARQPLKEITNTTKSALNDNS